VRGGTASVPAYRPLPLPLIGRSADGAFRQSRAAYWPPMLHQQVRSKLGGTG
jgi:hypothetical protein